MNISFITSGHLPYDDRIFYHMSRSLVAAKHNVTIISGRCQIEERTGDILLRGFDGNVLKIGEKLFQFISLLSQANPDIIICSEPFTILAARKYRKNVSHKIRIIYDVTEWYPSIRNIEYDKLPSNWIKYIQKLLFNYYISYYADSYIFGEWYKSKPYRFLFPLKPYAFISYYPDLKYIPFSKASLQENTLRLSYSGRISLEKGYLNFVNVINDLQKKKEKLQIKINIIGWYENDKDRMDCEKFMDSIDKRISVKYNDFLPFAEFLNLIKESDIFLDLRNIDYETTYCLPIKIFYYLAAGRPVIFSDLKSIVHEDLINKFGYLVKPDDTNSIVNFIISYLEKPSLYYEHCENARKLAEEKYNWKNIEPEFIRFIQNNGN